jgi:hypothetical protein
MKNYLLPVCAVLFLLPSVAFAAPAETNEEGALVNTNGPTRELIFTDDDNIQGEVLKPGGVQVGGAKAKEHASMIGIRGEFIDKLTALSNDI